MARLTDASYLEQRRALVEDWQSGGHGFTLNSALEQLTLHEHYRPAENLSDHEALAHRRKVGKETPSLPQRAGKAYMNRLKALAVDIVKTELRLQREKVAPPRKKYQRGTRGAIRVGVTMRPAPDYEKLAKAFLEHVRNEEQKKTATTDQDVHAA